MPRTFLGQIIRVVALLLMGLASTLPAQAQQSSPGSQAPATSVNGRNAMSVTIGQDGNRTGELHKADGTRWIETDASGETVYQYQEQKRDESSVYLVDRVRGMSVQLDLRARRATYKETSTRRTDLFEIQAATTVAAPQPSSTAQSQKPRQVGQFKARQSPGALVDDAPAPVHVEAPAFCWNDAATRGAGTLPGRVADCPAGFTNNGATCKRAADTIPAPSHAADCPAGYTNNGSACERATSTKANTNSRAADCPAGYSNEGTACFRLSAATTLGVDTMTCKGGETKVGSRCYKGCEAGFTSAGTSCSRPASTLGADKMACKAGFQKASGGQRCVAECAEGYANTGEACFRADQTLGLESMSCKAGEVRAGGRCVATTGNCAKGEVQQGGLCYTACAAGFDGVGSACVAQAPKTWAQCGMGAAKNGQACAAITLDQIASVKQRALFVGIGGATQKKFKDMTDAYNLAKDLAQFKKAQDTWEQANRGQGGYLALDKMASATSDEHMLRYAAQLLAIVELSGAPTIDAAAYPMCSKLFPGK